MSSPNHRQASNRVAFKSCKIRHPAHVSSTATQPRMNTAVHPTITRPGAAGLLPAIAGLGLLTFAGLTSQAAPATTPDLREAVTDPALGEVVRPDAAELRWMEIHWQTDLWQARRMAFDQGKPIFLWQMDGHPLGCV